MKLNEIHVGDVLVSVRRDIACVIEVKPESANPIRLQIKAGKTYQAKPDFFDRKIGTFDLDALQKPTDDGLGTSGRPGIRNRWKTRWGLLRPKAVLAL